MNTSGNKEREFSGFGNRHSYYSIDGNRIKEAHGYCSNEEHKGYISKKQMAKRKCIKKECPYLKKNGRRINLIESVNLAPQN